MLDSPRPAHSMSAHLNGFARSHHPVRIGMVAISLAATMLPGANAMAHARAAHLSAPRHTVTRASTVSRVSASRHATALSVAAKGQAKRGSLPARSMRFPETKAQVQIPSVNRHGHPVVTTRAAAFQFATKQRERTLPHATGNDVAADLSIEDRVHAWYRTRNATGSTAFTVGDEAPANDTAKRATATITPVKRTPLPQPDLALTPGKATAEDFNRAVQKQAEINRAAAAMKNTRSTADDDAAFAEASNIPSTAPTEREPLPFIHGDLLASTAHTSTPPKQATLTAKSDVPPIVRIDPRGDAEVLSAAAFTPAPVGETFPIAPKPVTILRSPAPAASAIAAAASKPKLDPRLAGSMAQQSLDDDEAPPIGKAAKGDGTATIPTAGGYVDLAAGPLVKVNLYNNAGKLILLPAMKGSHAILVHQNQMAIADGLDRVEDDRQMLDMRRLRLLVALPDTDAMYPDDRLPLNRRFARPWTVRFLNDLSQAHFARFHTPLIVTSAVRTVAFQRRLVLTNGNAAPPTGEVASPHLYGQAVDIAKHGMSMTEIAWMRSYLTPVESAGKIDVEEEFQQACFHLSVYRRYLGLPAPRNTPTPEVAPSRVLQQVKATPAKRRRIPTALLATGLR